MSQRFLLIALLAIAPLGCGKSVVQGPATEVAPSGAGGASVGDAGGGRSPGFDLPPASAGPEAGAGAPVSPGATGTCAAETHRATPSPVDLLLLVDKSGSMDLEVGTVGTQWELVREALMEFVRDPKSADIGVGLQLFPLVPKQVACTTNAECGADICIPARSCLGQGLGFPIGCTTDADCDPGKPCRPRALCARTGRVCFPVGQPCPGGRPDDICTQLPRTCRSRGFPVCNGPYQDPVVDIAPLPAAAETLASRLLVTDPAGQTPMAPAVAGALAHLQARAMANPGRRMALVLATDGYPLGCDPVDIPSIAMMVGAARARSPSIPTFVIGVFGTGSAEQARQSFGQLATAGGTGQAVIVEPNTELTSRFLEALNQIRAAALPCEFTIPTPQGAPLDHGKVNLQLHSAAGVEDVLYVEDAARCDPMRGGWYYDVNPAQGTPSRVVVCEATCRKFKTASQARVDLAFGCKTRVID